MLYLQVPSDDDSDWSFLTPSVQGNSQPSHSVSDLNSNISLAEDWENHPLLQSTQGTTQQDVPSTFDFKILILIIYNMTMMIFWKYLISFEYDWQFNGHRFIGERVSMIYPNGLTGIGTVQKYLPPMVMMRLYFIFFTMMVIKKIWMVMNVLLLWNSIVKISQLWIQMFCATFESKVVTFMEI